MMTSLGQWEQAKHQLQALQCSGGSAACGDKWRERNVHRQQQWGFSDAVMNHSQIGGALMQSNKHRLHAQKIRTGKTYLRQFFTDSHAQGSSHFCYCYSFPFPFVFPTFNHTWEFSSSTSTEILHSKTQKQLWYIQSQNYNFQRSFKNYWNSIQNLPNTNAI